MWEVKYDRWAEKWIVSEYTRSDEGLFWKTEADALAEMKNRRLHQQPTSSRSEFTEYDVYEPTDVWPGGFVSYGSSMG